MLMLHAWQVTRRFLNQGLTRAWLAWSHFHESRLYALERLQSPPEPSTLLSTLID